MSGESSSIVIERRWRCRRESLWRETFSDGQQEADGHAGWHRTHQRWLLGALSRAQQTFEQAAKDELIEIVDVDPFETPVEGNGFELQSGPSGMTTIDFATVTERERVSIAVTLGHAPTSRQARWLAAALRALALHEERAAGATDVAAPEVREPGPEPPSLVPGSDELAWLREVPPAPPREPPRAPPAPRRDLDEEFPDAWERVHDPVAAVHHDARFSICVASSAHVRRVHQRHFRDLFRRRVEPVVAPMRARLEASELRLEPVRPEIDPGEPLLAFRKDVAGRHCVRTVAGEVVWRVLFATANEPKSAVLASIASSLEEVVAATSSRTP